MKRLLLALLFLLAVPAAASAHPLGNFSVNHDATVTVRDDRVDVRYVLDQAEIPTFRERDKSPAEVLAATRAEAAKRLVLTVDGTRVALRPTGKESIKFPAGDGGLTTTYAVVELTAPVADAGQVQLRDETFPGRAGRKRVLSGEDAPKEDGFAGLFADAASGQGVLVLLLLAALGWGALHALSPGHGKAMVAAYLIGTKGRPRHAVALGVTVTVTHTIGVFALGGLTLGLSEFFLPEDLYPWLTLVSALLVLVVGAGVLRSRLKQRGHHHHHHHGHEHGHDHHHDVSWKGVLGMGTAAGLLPCPSALVVLLAAVSQHEVALGMLLIVAFSVGLALTLTTLGLAVVWAQRLPIAGRMPKQLASAVPAISAALIMGVGFVLTANAIPAVV